MKYFNPSYVKIAIYNSFYSDKKKKIHLNDDISNHWSWFMVYQCKSAPPYFVTRVKFMYVLCSKLH